MKTGSPLRVLKYSKSVRSVLCDFSLCMGHKWGKKIPLQNKENFVCYFLEYLEPASSLILIFFLNPGPAALWKIKELHNTGTHLPLHSS